MPWIGGAIAAGGSLLAGSMGADAAGDAARVQADSAAQSTAAQSAIADKALAEQRRQYDLGTAEQRRQYDQARADNAPYLRTGTAANQRLAQLLGLSSPMAPAVAQAPQAAAAPTRSWQDLYQEALSRAPAAVPEFISGGGYSYEGSTYDNLVKNPAFTQQQRPEDWARTEADRQFASQQQATPVQQQPVATATPLTGQTNYQLGGDSPLLRRFTADDLNADPVYQSGLKFGLDRGTEGINARGTAGGMYDSGATLKALTMFGNDYGSTKAGESYGRFTGDQSSIFNKLSGVSGTGQVASGGNASSGANAANSITGAGANYASGTSNIYGNLSNGINSGITGAGNARAAGIVGGANAWAGAAQGVNSAYGNYNNSKILQALIARNNPSASYDPSLYSN